MAPDQIDYRQKTLDVARKALERIGTNPTKLRLKMKIGVWINEDLGVITESTYNNLTQLLRESEMGDLIES